MPTVTDLRLFAVDLPFKVTVRHAAAARTSSESLFLRARLDNGAEGWGESLPRAYVSGESREQAFALLRDTILPALAGQSFRSLPEAVSFLEKCDGKAPPEWVRPEVPQTSAWCGVDLALLDAFGKASGEPAGPAVPDGQAPAAAGLERYRYSGVVSAGHGWPYATSLLKIRAFGFRQVKLKLEREGAVRAARTARRLLGRRVDLPRRRQHGLGRRAGPPAHRAAPGGRDPLVRAADRQHRPGRPDPAGGRVVGPDHGRRGPDRPRLLAALHRPPRLHRGERADLKVQGLIAASARCREALAAGLVLQVGCQVGESSLLSAAHLRLLSSLAPLAPGYATPRLLRRASPS